MTTDRHQQIESRLAGIENWSRLSGRNRIIESLGRSLRDGEQVEEMLVGFSKDDATSGSGSVGQGSGMPGALFLTDRRLLFLRNDLSNVQADGIDYDTLLAVKVKRGVQAIRVTLSGTSGGIIFNSTHSDLQTSPFIETLKGHVGDLLHFDRGASKGFTDEERLSNLNFLHIEARKIVVAINDYKQFDNEPAFLKQMVDDLLYVAGRCLDIRDEIPMESKLFVGMIFLCLRQRFPESREIVDELFRYDSLPVRLRRSILRYWESIYNEIGKIRSIGGARSLASLGYLRSYDRRENERHSDRIAALFFTVAQIIVKADGTTLQGVSQAMKRIRALIYNDGNEPKKKGSMTDATKAEVAIVEGEGDPEESLESVLANIETLIGMNEVKRQISTFINLIRVHNARKERNLPVTPISKHAVLYGPPGTGKTTIARYLGQVYRCLGLLKRGHLIETDRAGLVAGHVGQTAIQTDAIVQKALDGVLFIDEAYTLSPRDAGRDFGQEAIDVLLKRMEDYRERFVIIVAGYPDEMKFFIESNPGLKSRFNRYFYFDHYSPSDLLRIFNRFIKGAALQLTAPARRKLLDLLQELHAERDKTFGNGRLVRNLFEMAVEKQANRISRIGQLTDQILCSLTKHDMPNREDLLQPMDAALRMGR